MRFLLCLCVQERFGDSPSPPLPTVLPTRRLAELEIIGRDGETSKVNAVRETPRVSSVTKTRLAHVVDTAHGKHRVAAGSIERTTRHNQRV